MQKTQYLSTLCDQNARIDELFDMDGLNAPIYERMNFALSLCGHLLDELAQPQYNSAYFDRQLAQLTERVGTIALMVA